MRCILEDRGYTYIEGDVHTIWRGPDGRYGVLNLKDKWIAVGDLEAMRAVRRLMKGCK